MACINGLGALQHMTTHCCETLSRTATHCIKLYHAATQKEHTIGLGALQCTAPLYNTLYRTAAHSSTLQHTAEHCLTLQHNVTNCITLQHRWDTLLALATAISTTYSSTLHQVNSATHCNTLQHTATHCHTLPHTATHCNTLQHTATPCNTLEHTATH